MLATKTVSAGRDYIDYTADRVGIRVRAYLCQPIVLQRGRWTQFHLSYPIPVEPALLEARETGMSILASGLRRVEESRAGSNDASELRLLITGRISFEDALESALVNS